MAAKSQPQTGALRQPRGVSPLTRAIAAGVGCLMLVTPFAHATEKFSLVQHNQLSAPYPGSYTKQALAKVARQVVKVVKPAPLTPPAPAPVAVVKPAPPAKKSALELALQHPNDDAVYERIQRSPSRVTSPALVEAIVGSDQKDNGRAKVKIGYGKPVSDTSNTVGMRNGTRLEEPGCLYVKTSVTF